MSASESNLSTAKTVLSVVGSFAATAVVVHGVAQEFIPPEFYNYIFSSIRSFFSSFSNKLTMVIDEFQGLDSNQIYVAAESYLGTKLSPNTRRLKISLPEKEKRLNVSMVRGQEIVDLFNGHKFKWVLICRKVETNSTLRAEVRSFELTFHNKNRAMVIDSYLPHIANEARIMKQEKKTIKIYALDFDNMCSMNDIWKPVTLDHPATFETLAMDSDQKESILKDVDRFLRRREHYRKVGKAWKRGYLLYGPPGTGKSSLIAAMANYLKFDVYDLELTELRRNSDLRMVLLATANKSILVVEDIDCTINLANREASSMRFHHNEDSNKVTLSGLLNMVDGLWSSIGDERIIIFTTNHVEKLDPALLRPGRMDMHINMSYCTPHGFRVLASNYLEIEDHPMFPEIDDMLKNAKATPAEVAEQLLKDDDAGASLQGLIGFLHKKMIKFEDLKAAAHTEEEMIKSFGPMIFTS